MASSNHYLRLYTGDYLRDTRHLTVTEHGAYLLLLMQEWDTGPIPNDDATIAHILRLRVDVWKRMAPRIRPFFTVLPDGRLAQKRLEEERLKVAVIREKRAEAGGQGGKAKSLKRKDAPVANARTLPEHDLANATITNARDSEELRSPAAVAAVGQVHPPTEQTSEVTAGRVPGVDLFELPPPAPPAPPTPTALLFGEGIPKLIQMTEQSRDRLGRWLGKMRKASGNDDVMILALIQETHRRWVARDTAVADPIGWISAGVKSRIAGHGKAAQVEIPTEINGRIVSEIVAHCGDLMAAEPEGAWPGFTAIIAEMMTARANPEAHIFPVMKAAARKGVRTIDSVGWFRFAISGRLHGTEHAA